MLSNLVTPSVAAICIGIDAKEIELTLASLSSICYLLDEIIIVDSSPNGLISIPPVMSSKVNHLKQYPPEGVSQAFNNAIKNASSRYVVFYNSGDICIPQGFSYSYSLICKNMSLRLVAGSVHLEHFSTGHKKITIWRPRAKRKHVHQVHHIGTIYERKLHDECGFYDPLMMCAMDYSFFVRALYFSDPHQIATHSEPVGIFRMGGISSKMHSLKCREVLSADLLVRKNLATSLARYSLSLFKNHLSMLLAKLLSLHSNVLTKKFGSRATADD